MNYLIFAWTWRNFTNYAWRVKSPNIFTWMHFAKWYRGPSVFKTCKLKNSGKRHEASQCLTVTLFTLDISTYMYTVTGDTLYVCIFPNISLGLSHVGDCTYYTQTYMHVHFTSSLLKLNTCQISLKWCLGLIPGGVTPIYELYRYVPLWRVWFSTSLL